MGTWGAGNFDEDTAADHLSIVTNRLIKEIENAFTDLEEIEPDQYWGVAVPCNLDLLRIIYDQEFAGSILPTYNQLVEWKQIYMKVWDESIDYLEPKPDYRENRRLVLLNTFDELIKLAIEHER